MKHTLFSISLLIILLSSQGCKCVGEGKNLGIIVNDAPNILCRDLVQELVITSQQQLDSLNEEYTAHGYPCNTTETVDFNVYSMLSNEGTGTCRSSYDKKVTRDDANRKYIFTTTEHSCNCWHKIAKVFPCQVIVPKLPDNYTVEFIKNGD